MKERYKVFSLGVNLTIVLWGIGRGDLGDGLALIAAIFNLIYFMKWYQKFEGIIASVSFPLTILVTGLEIVRSSHSIELHQTVSTLLQTASMICLLLEVCYNSLPELQVVYPILFCSIFTTYRILVVLSGLGSSPELNYYTPNHQLDYYQIVTGYLYFFGWTILCQYLWQALDYLLHKAFKSFKQITFYLGLVMMITRFVRNTLSIFTFKREIGTFSKINP